MGNSPFDLLVGKWVLLVDKTHRNLIDMDRNHQRYQSHLDRRMKRLGNFRCSNTLGCRYRLDSNNLLGQSQRGQDR